MIVVFNGANLQIMQSQNDSDIDMHESTSAEYTPQQWSSSIRLPAIGPKHSSTITQLHLQVSSDSEAARALAALT